MVDALRCCAVQSWLGAAIASGAKQRATFNRALRMSFLRCVLSIFGLLDGQYNGREGLQSADSFNHRQSKIDTGQQEAKNSQLSAQ